MSDSDALTSKQVAFEIGKTDEALRAARSRDADAPPYKKLSNGRVVYSKAGLSKWLEERKPHDI